MALYVIENNDERLLIDTSSELAARKVVRELKNQNLYPIHKLVLTHSHWDHTQGLGKLRKLLGEEIEVFAHENALNDLRNPKTLIEAFGYDIAPAENINPLKEGDIINLAGLELKILEFFGHTSDSIGLLDNKNKILYLGDAIFYIFDENTYIPNIMPPYFNQEKLLKSFQKLKDLRSQIDSIAISHYGVYSGEDLDNIVNNLEPMYKKCRDVIIQAYKKNPSHDAMAEMYHNEILSKSDIFTKEHLGAINLFMEWLSNGIKAGKLI
jgi:glyoxylase-like metal-dependent hydrolase (beta-lactamase superfamily II)